MRVLVAGGTGVIGRQLLPLLAEGGDEVIVLSRPTSKVGSPSVKIAYVDVLIRGAVRAAVRNAAPT